MKTLLALALITLASPALAQTAPAPAPGTKMPAVAPAPVATAKFNLDTPIETIMADPAGKAVLAADMGGDLSLHPMYDSFKSMSLSQVAPMSSGKITDDMLKKAQADLAAIK